MTVLQVDLRGALVNGWTSVVTPDAPRRCHGALALVIYFSVKTHLTFLQPLSALNQRRAEHRYLRVPLRAYQSCVYQSSLVCIEP